MKRIIALTLCMVLATNSFAISKPLKFIISGVLIAGGIFMIVQNARNESQTHTTTITTTTTVVKDVDTDTHSGGYNPWTGQNDPITNIVTDTVTTTNDTQTNTVTSESSKMKDEQMALLGAGLVLAGVGCYVFINPVNGQTNVGVQTKF